MRWSQFDLIDELVRIGAYLVSLKTCYFPGQDEFWDELTSALDNRHLERAIAWGAPRGLKRGTDQNAGSATELAIVSGLDTFPGIGLES